MDIGELALAYWRLNKWVTNVSVERKSAAQGSLRQMKKYLDKNNVELLDFCGQKYDSGFAIDVIGVTTDKNLPEEEMIISETLCPLILQNGEILKYGQVMLGETIKESAANMELPPDPVKAIETLNGNISSYCKAEYRDIKIAKKLKRCSDKLKGQLIRMRKGR